MTNDAHTSITDQSDPIVSVVTPCHGRQDLVGELLCSLSEARKSVMGVVEILIIDSSTSPSCEEIANACREHDATYLRGPKNVRQKRNLGCRSARGKYILFIDSDCVADSDLIINHLQAVRTIEPYRVGGSVGITQFVGKATWVNRLAEASPFTAAFRFAREMPYCSWATTSNLLVSREAFDAVGGFDETLPFTLGGDDLDLTWRIRLSGRLLKATPNAVVFHNRQTWSHLRSLLSRVWRWGRVEHHIRLKHRARLRRQFPPALFWVLAFLCSSLTCRFFGHPEGARFSAVALAVLSLGFVTEHVWKRRSLERSEWMFLPLLVLLDGLYRLGSWRESARCLHLPPLFEKLYFDEWHLRAEVENQAVAAWALLASLVVAICWGAR